MFSSLNLVAIFAVAASSSFALVEYGLSHEQLGLIRQRLEDSAHASWELGTAAEAFLQIDYPAVSVFGVSPFPPPETLPEDSPIITIAKGIIETKPQGLKALIPDGAAGDPPSNGIAVLLANWSIPEDHRYLQAFHEQIDFLQNDVPRTEDFAISHRTEYPQLWSDFIFMVPPTFAYYGAIQPGTQDEWDFLHEAYNQIKLYRNYLLDESTGVWKHIMEGPWSDEGLWATGQGWAAMGMMRVYQSIAKSTIRDQMQWALDDLLGWTEQVVQSTWKFQSEDGSLKNYLGREDSFREMSSTALMAACTYRLSMITDTSAYIHHADKAFELVKTMIDEEGWLKEPVNPHTFSQPGEHSPEGQAFVLMLQAAFRDYQAFHVGISNSLADTFKALADAAAQALNKDATPTSAKFARHVHARKHH